MNKFYPHKSCSCKACKKGKRKSLGIRNYIERKFRRTTKIELTKSPEEFNNTSTGGMYYD